MCNCDLECDCLVLDLTMFIFRLFAEKVLKKNLNKNFNFLFRCYIGFTFDGIEYGILTTTADAIDYGRFETIFTVMGIFIGIITVLFCCNYNIYIVLAVLVFKSISLIIALFIFTTTMGFNWNNIERMFVEMDSAEDFFLALVAFISFVDICLIIATIAIKILVICCCIAKNEGHCLDFICSDDDDNCTIRVFSSKVD